MYTPAMPTHQLRATLVRDEDGARQYLLEFAGHESITVLLDDGGDMHLLTRCGWAELGSTVGIEGGTAEHLARAASMAFAISGEFVVTGIRAEPRQIR